MSDSILNTSLKTISKITKKTFTHSNKNLKVEGEKAKLLQCFSISYKRRILKFLEKEQGIHKKFILSVTFSKRCFVKIHFKKIHQKERVFCTAGGLDS